MRNLTSFRSAVLCTKYSVLSTQYFVPTLSALTLLLTLFAATTGCQSSTAPTEPSLDRQLELVKAGKSDLIQLESQPVTDDDLAKLLGATSLRILLIDNPKSHITAAGLKHISSLPKLEHLRLRGSGIDDAALAELAKIQSLKILNLPQGQFTDDGLTQLKSLSNLIQLRFKAEHVTDAGMQTLAEFPALARLHLIDIPITDAGLKTLAGMEKLESLYIDGGNFSNSALDDLFAKRPSLHVHLNQEHHDRDPHKHP